MERRKKKENEKKRVSWQKVPRNAVVLIIILIGLGVFLFQKPSITGKVIQGKETIFSENLNLQVNESGTYEWQVKNPGSIKSIKATGSVTSNGTAKVYIEKNGTRQLLFDSTKHLFDIDIDVLPEYKKIFQGDKILIQNILYNLRGFGAGNVNVKYSIKDSDGNLIAAEEEKIFVETRAQFIRELVMPAEIRPGTYVAFVEATTNGSIVLGSGSDTFEVKSLYAESGSRPFIYYIVIGISLAALILLIGVGVYEYGMLKRKKGIAELKEKEPEEKIKRLENELKALEDAYKSGMISQGSYQSGKKRVEETLKITKKT
ncbi:hypothetical protein HYV80_01280 [Candidatus Woesearchaeota archaeon]|nr:hypothetical protein [Candidatus Woesearchaeota archaeon]